MKNNTLGKNQTVNLSPDDDESTVKNSPDGCVHPPNGNRPPLDSGENMPSVKTPNDNGRAWIVAAVVSVALVVGGIVYFLRRADMLNRLQDIKEEDIGQGADKAGEDAWTNKDKILNINGYEYKLKPVRSGRFQMGSPEKETGRLKCETRHWVILTKDFWLGETEVTQALWKEIMGTTLQQQVDKIFTKDMQRFLVLSEGEKQPMSFITWDEAMEFCKKLTERERSAGRLSDKWEFTLPTEAQWEYAARGGVKSKGYKYSGGNDLKTIGWYYENSGLSTLDENNIQVEELMTNSNQCTSHSVGLKPPNELGIYDMSGNVWEWCLDSCEHNAESGVITDTYKDDIVDPWNRIGSSRVIRGGSCRCFTAYCRSAMRDSNGQQSRGIDAGFRIALVPVQ